MIIIPVILLLEFWMLSFLIAVVGKYWANYKRETLFQKYTSVFE